VPVVERVVNEEKLRQLLSEQTESETLDYKATCDLSQKRDEIELAKDLGAMLMLGGFVVIGADSRGKLSGLLEPAQAAMLDEARLRAKMAKYLPEPFDLLAASHTIDGRLAGVIYIGPHEDCLAVFKADGQYRDAKGRDIVVFRKGDVFARHGSSSEAWRQGDIDLIKRCIEERRKEGWRREFTEDLEQMGIGRRAAALTEGPAANFTWRLDAATFQAATVELLRRRDRIPLQLLAIRAPEDAARLRITGDQSEFQTLIDRLACLATTGITLEQRWLAELGIEALGRVYDLGSRDVQTAEAIAPAMLWLSVIERVYSIGGYAVRRGDWRTVRYLALRTGEPENSRRFYKTWIRHALTMAARAGLFRSEQGGRSIELSLLSLAQEITRQEACLRPDADAEDERVLNSLCQFDALAALTAIADAKSLESHVYYTSFARFFSYRTEPAISRLISDPAMRKWLFPGTDPELADALREVHRMASREAFAYAGWDGFEDPAIIQFIERNLTPNDVSSHEL
jgi:hypothetical protein